MPCIPRSPVSLSQELAFRPDSAESNSIVWLVWHLTRIQDDHVAGLDSSEQVWISRGVGRPVCPARSIRQIPDMATTPTLVGGGHGGCPPVARVLRGGPCQNHRAAWGTLADADLARVVERELGPSGHHEHPAGERDRRRPPARGSGGVRPGNSPTTLKCPKAGSIAGCGRPLRNVLKDGDGPAVRAGLRRVVQHQLVDSHLRVGSGQRFELVE